MRPLVLLPLLAACADPPVATPPELQLGALRAGAAEARLELPIGTPLGCFSSRCRLLGSDSRQDRRQGAYNVAFEESTGIHTRAAIKALWLENGDDHFVLVKTDLCMANEAMVAAITQDLEASTGAALEGRVVLTVSHSHSSYGSYNDMWHWYLGTDRYNQEIFDRMRAQFSAVALNAWNAREEASLGVAWARDWDPDDRVYRDRRDANDALVLWEDQAEWATGKDPHLAVLRVDDLEGEPIAAAFVFGVHGTVLGADNPMLSGDSTGGIEEALAEHFPAGTVVMHVQGAGGDASPGGVDHGFARTEAIGALAAPPLLDLWSRTPVSAAPLRMASASRSLWQYHQAIRVTRGGTVDWTYAPPVEPPESFAPDNRVYDENGAILSPIDEFNAPYGAAFCASDAPLPVASLGADVYPYDSCSRVDAIAPLIAGTFDFTVDDIHLPFPETLKASVTATRIGPIPTLTPEGEVVQRDLFGGFFPGEVTATYSEQFRRRSAAELGLEGALTVGYAQDHEGYLLLPEDWLAGGYEPNINVWGPLQGEHILEGALYMAGDALDGAHRHDPDPTGWYAPFDWPTHPLPTRVPDLTPDAGTRLTEPTEGFWVPEGFAPRFEVPAQVPRGAGVVQLAWEGGDPMVDPPHVYLEHQDEGGAWHRVLSASGRPISEAMTDILVGYTPDPLFPVDDPQRHLYWAAWQAVGHVHDRLGVPAGTYRLKVEGLRWAGGNTTWPWSTEPYELAGPSFEVVPAEIRLEAVEDGLWAWVDAPPEGWRLIDLEGDSRGRNPIRGLVQVSTEAGPVEVAVSRVEGGRAFLAVDLGSADEATVTDAHGNRGVWSAPRR